MITAETIRAPEFDNDAIRIYLVAELRKYGEEIIKEFNKTTVGWKKNRAKFETHQSTSKFEDTISVQVYTTNKIWNYIDQGVEGHAILANPNVKIAPVETYTPLSMPGTLSINSSGGKRTFEGKFFNPNKLRIFWWTGIKAREFTQQIGEGVASDPGNIQRRFQAVFDKHADKMWK